MRSRGRGRGGWPRGGGRCHALLDAVAVQALVIVHIHPELPRCAGVHVLLEQVHLRTTRGKCRHAGNGIHQLNKGRTLITLQFQD
jgi:hypothetical protein